MIDNTNGKIDNLLSEDINRSFSDNDAYACLTFDELNNIKRINQKCILEFPDLVLGNNILSYLDEVSKTELLKSIKNIKATSFVEKLEVTLIIGEKTYDVEIFMTHLHKTNEYPCILKDKIVLNEMRLDNKSNKEDETMPLISKDKSLLDFSHDIRTPLNSIMGALSILKETDLTLNQEGLLTQSFEASLVLLATVNDFLNIPNKEEDHTINKETNFDIKKMLEKIIEQVMINLVDNAVKYTFEGSVDIKLMALTEKISVDKVNFIVEDTGIGISKEDLEEVFSPYIERKIEHVNLNSMGIGLPICKKLIKSLGGELVVDSHKGLGSKFEVVIPLNSSDKENCKFYDDKLEEKKFRAIILEDDPINQMIMSIRLEKLGILCDVAVNGQKGVELCMDNQYDIVFMDCQMPIVDGYEATRRIRKLPSYEKTPIFALTGHAFNSERDKIQAAGMDEHFTKPIDFNALIEKIQQYLL